jgi:hypothetical protein
VTRSKRPGSHARRAGAIATLQALSLTAAGAAALVGFAAPAREHRPSVALLAIAVALLASAAWRVRRAQRWRIGRHSERAVQRRLRRLRRRGWIVVHDVDRGRGNVDHLAIGPRGVFAIETKTTRRGATELAQARANAAWAATRLGVPVCPVLCVTSRRQPPRLVAGVTCVDVRRLQRALLRRRLGPVEVDAVARRLPKRT